MKSKIPKTVLLMAGLASADGTCPEKIFGSNPSLTRSQFCETFQAMGDSTFSIYTITIPKPNAMSDTENQAQLKQVAQKMFGDYPLLNYRDSTRLPSPTQASIEYDSILMTKATAVALSREPYLLGLKTFLPSRQFGCPDKIWNGRPDDGSLGSRTDSVSCALFKNLGDSGYALYTIELPRTGHFEDRYSAENRARLQVIAESMFTKYDIRDYRDSARLVLPFKGIQADWSIDYAYGFVMMTKATALNLIQEPYILGLWFDPKPIELTSLRPLLRAKPYSPIERGRDALGRVRKRASGGVHPVFPKNRIP